MILFALLLAGAQPAEDPAAFVYRIYGNYGQGGYSPLLNPEKLFSQTLTAAINQDSSGGEVGYLDGDPLCDCQDYEAITARIVSMKRPNARSATARVHVTLGPAAERDLKLNLVLTASGWRIADVVDPRGHSLLRELQRSNAKR
jgi:uncharacterized protein DUF3828